MMDRAAPYLILIGRIMLSIIFIQYGWSKIFGYAETVGYMNAVGVPGALLPLVILTELGGGLLVLLGLFTRCADRPRRVLRARGLAVPLPAGRHDADD
jgi:putative oxidoreductase